MSDVSGAVSGRYQRGCISVITDRSKVVYLFARCMLDRHCKSHFRTAERQSAKDAPGKGKTPGYALNS
jgi:hypothetical protein